MTARPVRSKTAEDILDCAQALIQSRGYSAFSYQDIADALGIRKASIHHHFRSKADLGLCVVERYAERFAVALKEIAADPNAPSAVMFDRYVAPYRSMADTPDRVCLGGALAGEMPVLPFPLRARLEKFFAEHQDWLAAILARGASRGEFHLSGCPVKLARLAFSALQGALLVSRTTGDASQLCDVIATLRMQFAGTNEASPP